ncbi:tetratricopeptide repeat protein [Acetobacter sp. LMG 32666]|uniref:tetratricopeptide repeat protein n=1 Tax=Acetobacter sp. LMG 32666 TaxID=2959295 RepID=UPI0030C82913
MTAIWEPEKAKMQKLMAQKQQLLQNPDPLKAGELCEALCHNGLTDEGVRLALELVGRFGDQVPYLLVGAYILSTHAARYDIAAALLHKVVVLDPQNAAARIHLAKALVAKGDLAGGSAQLADVIRRHPEQRVDAVLQISETFLRMGYPQEALDVMLFTIQQVAPQAQMFNLIGCALGCLNRSEEAIPWYRQGGVLDPENEGIKLGHALALLKSGHYAEGWERFAARSAKLTQLTRRLAQMPLLQRGDDVAGKTVVLYQEQGLGDTLQFIRFVPYLVERGAQVTVAVGGVLERLLRLSYPDLNVRLLTGFTLEERFDYSLPIPNLPYITCLRDVADIPATVPYLRADPQDVARFGALLPPGRPRIGLVWSGDKRLTGEDVLADQLRSLSLAVMGAAISPVDATLVSLQFGAPRQELATWQGQPIFDPMDHVHDMADTAALMDNLDLIISVDTSPLHLAGALGRPVWMISRWDACWRWGDAGEHTPWYPSLRIFRPQERSFGPVLAQVGAALQAWVATARQSMPHAGSAGQNSMSEMASLLEEGAAATLPEGMTVEKLWEQRRALLQTPAPEQFRGLVTMLFELGHHVAAERLVRDMLLAHPEDTSILLSGLFLLSTYTSRHDLVVALLRKVMHLLPDLHELKLYLANGLIAQGDLSGGLRVFADIMQNHPKLHLYACEHMSLALQDAGYLDEACRVLEDWFRNSEETTPALDNNMACVLQRLNRTEESLKWYEKAVKGQPDNPAITTGYGLTLFKAGRFGEGRPYYASRVLGLADPLAWYHNLPRLEAGDAVAGKSIVVCQEQGFGDSLQFVRFVPQLVAAGATVTLAMPSNLVRLFTLSFPMVTVVEDQAFTQREGYDYRVLLPDLPFVMGVETVEDIPANIPYLKADPNDVARFAARMPARRPRIGLVWAGGKRPKAADSIVDQRRSTALANVGPALTPVNAELINLQHGPAHQELAAWHGQPIFDLMADVYNMADTAAVVESLDLVVSVDTSIVHLAGGLGKPVWMVSRRDACWRWGESGETSPWYPTLRIFRAQERSFGPVLEQMGQALRQWVATWHPGKGALD